MARRILITSGKGGVGKTTIVANLGYVLARSGLKVLLFDVDFGLNNLDVVMGIEKKIEYDIVDVVEGRCKVRQAVVDTRVKNLYVLPTNHVYASSKIDHTQLNAVINDIEDCFDYIFIDCPAGIDNGFRRAVECSGEAIVVTTPHISALRDCDKIVGALRTLCVDNVSVALNRVRGDMIMDGEMLSVDVVQKYIQMPICAVIPDDDVVQGQLLIGGAVNVDCNFTKSIEMMADYIHNGKKKLYDPTKRYKGLVGAIRRLIRHIA